MSKESLLLECCDDVLGEIFAYIPYYTPLLKQVCKKLYNFNRYKNFNNVCQQIFNYYKIKNNSRNIVYQQVMILNDFIEKEKVFRCKEKREKIKRKLFKKRNYLIYITIDKYYYNKQLLIFNNIHNRDNFLKLIKIGLETNSIYFIEWIGKNLQDCFNYAHNTISDNLIIIKIIGKTENTKLFDCMYNNFFTQDREIHVLITEMAKECIKNDNIKMFEYIFNFDLKKNKTFYQETAKQFNSKIIIDYLDHINN